MEQITCPACHQQVTIDTTILPMKPVVLSCPDCNASLLFHRGYPNETRISRSAEQPLITRGEMRNRQNILRGQVGAGGANALEMQPQAATVQLLLDIRNQTAKNSDVLSEVLATLRSIQFIMENFKVNEHR